MTGDLSTFEASINGFLSQAPPYHVSEAVLDHDYTLLSMKTYRDGAKDIYMSTVSSLKRMETNIVEPIKAFLQSDGRSFRETCRNLEQTQRQYDNIQSRYSGLSKNKELSALREDAFQLHEVRKAYLKASMDFGMVAPQLKMALDKVLVKAFSDQWRDTRHVFRAPLDKMGNEVERIYRWSRDMESGEKSLKRELQIVRRQIEETAEARVRPSRELEDYDIGSAPASRSRGPSTTNLQSPGRKVQPTTSTGKQGWLCLRIMTGKPSRTIWLRRWFYINNGIFGWLIQGSRSGAVEESERIGVLLCNVRHSNADDRRYVFEVKTKDMTIVVQAETRPDIDEWLAVFEAAKRKALEIPASAQISESGAQAQDPAFAISPPSAPEFAASVNDSGTSQQTEEGSSLLTVDRSSTLPLPGTDVANRNNFDIVNQKRSFGERENEISRDPASRIIQKLDLHRKSAANDRGAANSGVSGSGIASLIAASHSSMSIGPGALPTPPSLEPSNLPRLSPALPSVPISTLAPITLANPPTPTNLSPTAVIVNGERGIRIDSTDSTTMGSGGLIANIWGSTNWSCLNVLAPRVSLSTPWNPQGPRSDPPDPNLHTGSSPKLPTSAALSEQPNKASSTSPLSHRKTVSLDTDAKPSTISLELPDSYPLQLKTQDAQFHLLFPVVRREERVVLVFRATWKVNEQQELSGRIYVTTKNMYFYSNYCGLTLISSIDLNMVLEITAATGKDCDFIFCHLSGAESQLESSCITIKVFLEPMGLLQRRLSFLIRNRGSNDLGIEDVLAALIRMEQDDPDSSSGLDSWEDVSINTPLDNDAISLRKVPGKIPRDHKANLLIDRGLYGGNSAQLDGPGEAKAFKLPKQPVVYAPPNMKMAGERDFQVSPKALFHVMFGDKSAIFQLLYHERHASQIRQFPWSRGQNGHFRRLFDYRVVYKNFLQQVRQIHVEDHQIIDEANEHLLYIVSDRKKPWHLPHRDNFLLHTKLVITHLAKSKCKLAIYTRIEWAKNSAYSQSIVTGAALNDLETDALDLMDVVAEQVRNFASTHGRTKKAIDIFGQVPGAQSQVLEFAGSEAVLKAQLRRSMKPRTLIALAFESFGSTLESVLTSAGQIIWKFVEWIWSTVNANGVILAILAISLLFNIIVSSTTTSDWWKDRRARFFMSRLGIGSDLSMSKAIYLEELRIPNALGTSILENTGSQCRDTFNSVMNLDDTEPLEPLNTYSSMKPMKTMTAHRLQRTRHRLGTYRHDLLVATRVLNAIEHEAVQAEWEKWLLQEHTKCKQLEGILNRNATELAHSHSIETLSTLNPTLNRVEEIRDWHKGYCQSCRNEQQHLRSA